MQIQPKHGKVGSRQQRGFNLIEIMFALLLLALVVTVSVETSSGDFAAFTRMKDATFARWVAFNQISLALTAKDFPSTGKREGSTDMGQTTWVWQQEITATADTDVRQITVMVFRKGQEKQVQAMEVGYATNPQAKAKAGAS